MLDQIGDHKLKCSELWEKLGDIFPTTFVPSTNQVLTVSSALPTRNLKNLSYQICNKTIHSVNELKLMVVAEFEKVIAHRENLYEELEVFYEDGKFFYMFNLHNIF